MSSTVSAATATGSPIILHQFRPAWDLQVCCGHVALCCLTGISFATRWLHRHRLTCGLTAFLITWRMSRTLSMNPQVWLHMAGHTVLGAVGCFAVEFPPELVGLQANCPSCSTAKC